MAHLLPTMARLTFHLLMSECESDVTHHTDHPCRLRGSFVTRCSLAVPLISIETRSTRSVT